MLPEDALENKPEALGGPTGRRVGGIAFPLQPPVAQDIERMPGHDEDRFGRLPGPLQLRRKPDVADLDHAVLGNDAHERCNSARGLSLAIDDRESQRIVQRGAFFEPRHEFVFPRERSVGQVGPGRVRAGRRRKQVVAMPSGVERLEQHALAGKG